MSFSTTEKGDRKMGSMGLDDALEFFNAYLDAEYGAVLACRTEVDEVLDARVQAAETFWHAEPGGIISLAIGRRPGYSVDELAAYARGVSQVARRVLFIIAEHHHAKWGRVFGAHLSNTRSATTGLYGALLYAAEVGDELKLIAEYAPEVTLPAPPVQWTHVQGADLGDLGRPLVAQAPTEPTYGGHREDWAAFLGRVG